MKSMEANRNNAYVRNDDEAKGIINIILGFLTLFMPITLAKRVISMILIAGGVKVSCIVELTGLTDRSVKTHGRKIRNGEVSSLLNLKEGRGRKSKAYGIEDQILAEVENGNYHTRQQISEMIKEKFNISMSVSAVGKLLKKTTYEN